MLVLSRKPGKAFTIGDSITVMVLAIRGDVVRIGIDAPAEVPIVRDDAKKRERCQQPSPESNT